MGIRTPMQPGSARADRVARAARPGRGDAGLPDGDPAANPLPGRSATSHTARGVAGAPSRFAGDLS
jgi:hypothetical protein